MSKLSTALIRPTQPIWNKSSTLYLLLSNLCTIDNTKRKLPFIKASLLRVSPSCILINNFLISSLVSVFRLLVLIPAISTLYLPIISPNQIMEILLIFYTQNTRKERKKVIKAYILLFYSHQFY